jgi:hypothetical protein
MAGTQEPNERDTMPAETPGAAGRGEYEWSRWERQKLEVYRRERPGTAHNEPTTEEEVKPS